MQHVLVAYFNLDDSFATENTYTDINEQIEQINTHYKNIFDSTDEPLQLQDANIINQMNESIDINEQIERIYQIYQKIFGTKTAVSLKQKLTDYFLSKSANNSKCIVLTSFITEDVEYDFAAMKYAYLSKYFYSQIHSYIFIIDTFDYLTYLNIPKFQYFQSLTIEQLTYISSQYMKIFETYDKDYINNFNATAKHSFGNDNYVKYFNKTTKSFDITTKVTNHWNKVLSQIYWSLQHGINCILQMDDDAFIGNYNLSITYWLNLLNSSFLILPYDDISIITFSNFGYILYDKNKNKLLKFLLLWWKNRKKPFGGWRFDQDAMYNAILKYLSIIDNNFKRIYLNRFNIRAKKWKLCVDYCSQIVPVSHRCDLQCYRIFKIMRPTTTQIMDKNYRLSVLWAPMIKTPLSYIQQSDNLYKYKYDIYPFSMQLNWGNAIWASIVFDTDTKIKEKEKSNLNIIFENHAVNKTKMILDITYIIHCRLTKVLSQQYKYRQILESAIQKMEIFNKFTL